MKKSKLLELLGLDKIIDSIQNLIEVRIAIIKREVEEKIAEKLVKVLPLLMVMLTLNLLILFASLALAFYLSDLLGSYTYGFGLVGIFYLILSIIMYLLKDSKSLKGMFAKSIKTKNTED